jgi:molybdopterin-dependent oxidoreductase alpha subunit
MAKPSVSAGGGIPSITYVLKKGREAGGLLRLWRRLRSRNACKTCAFGMGGAKGGMVTENGHFPEVCKKSVQAQAGDMSAAIPESFFAARSFDVLEKLSSRELEQLGRLAFPVFAEAGATHFRRISWDEALDLSGAALRDAPPDEVFFYASGRSSNEAAFLLQLVARAYGSPNIHNCSHYCHAASGVALSQVYGSGTASIVLDDLEKADLAMVAGANPASNHPRVLSHLIRLRRRGGRVIVVNPLRELGLLRFRLPSDWRSFLFGSDVCDLYLQPHVGGDVALFKALLQGLIEADAIDREFIEAATTGWADVEADARDASRDELERAHGVPRRCIDKAVGYLAEARHGILSWAMGLTHHAHGVDNVLALSNLALARGWLGKPGAGLLPLRGHSNVQGVGSVGMTPALKRAFAAKLEELYDIRVPADPGQDTYASMVAADEGRIRASVLLGGNLFASNPDRTWAAGALRRIPLSVSLTTKLNEGHIHGRGRATLLLPVLARDEEPQPTTQESMFNYVRRSEGGQAPPAGEMWSEVDVIASLAERVLPEGRFDWQELRSHRRLREGIAAVVPGFGSIVDDEFQIEGRTFHEPRFATSDGRARFRVTPLPELPRSEYRLMTLRSEGQFNTVVYEEEDLYRGNTRRDVVMMAKEDAERLGVAEGDRVLVGSETGRLEVRVAIAELPPGNLAMYYPEANVLVPRRLDPLARTPAFKSVAATVQKP